MKRRVRHLPRHRRGVILPLSALLLVLMVAMIAFAIDLGSLQVARTQLQQSADAAALAAASELVDDDSYSATVDLTDEILSARTQAAQYAAANKIFTSGPTIDQNTGNSTSGDVVVGYLQDPSNQSQSMAFTNMNQANAVQVRVQRTQSSNGEVHLFFGRALGVDSQGLTATATAALLKNFAGFKAPSDGSNLGILPFAIDEQTWNDMLSGGGSDIWAWDNINEVVKPGSDGTREVNLYPQGTGSPGNRGTVDIGASNNSTSDIARQIVHGISPTDLAQLPNGQLAIGQGGTLDLNGDTGISAGVKDELASIVGKTRVVPVFESVTGPGNNAVYHIVKWVGVRVLDVKLTGAMSGKRLIIQPANVKMEGGIAGGATETSNFIHSPVWIVR